MEMEQLTLLNKIETKEPLSDAKRFIFAGNARFTFVNSKSGNRFTYQVRKSKTSPTYFVAVLSGPDNIENYRYMGVIFEEEMIFKWTKKSRVKPESTSFRAFYWLFNMLKEGKELPDYVKIYHEGRCGRCGKVLTVPESILSGFGPECINKA